MQTGQTGPSQWQRSENSTDLKVFIVLEGRQSGRKHNIIMLEGQGTAPRWANYTLANSFSNGRFCVVDYVITQPYKGLPPKRGSVQCIYEILTSPGGKLLDF